jgi:hypothetical protein
MSKHVLTFSSPQGTNWNLTLCFFHVLFCRSDLIMTLSPTLLITQRSFYYPRKIIPIRIYRQNVLLSVLQQPLLKQAPTSILWPDYLMVHKRVQNSPFFQTARQIIIKKHTTRQYSWNRVTSSDTTYNKLLWSNCTKTTSIRRFFACLVSRVPSQSLPLFPVKNCVVLKRDQWLQCPISQRLFAQYREQVSANRDMWKIIHCTHFSVCFFLIY